MHDWTAVAVIIFGYAAGAYFQAKYIDAKFQTMEAKFQAMEAKVEGRLVAIEQRLDAIEKRLTRVEERLGLEHPVLRP